MKYFFLRIKDLVQKEVNATWARYWYRFISKVTNDDVFSFIQTKRSVSEPFFKISMRELAANESTNGF